MLVEVTTGYCWRKYLRPLSVTIKPNTDANNGRVLHQIICPTFYCSNVLVKPRSTLTLWQCAAKIILAFLIFAVLVLRVDDCRPYTPF